jgi:hypothetical protein
MYEYPEQAMKEATHTDENGYMYKQLSPLLFMYWDRRFNGWFQEMTKDLSFLIKL